MDLLGQMGQSGPLDPTDLLGPLNPTDLWDRMNLVGPMFNKSDGSRGSVGPMSHFSRVQ